MQAAKSAARQLLRHQKTAAQMTQRRAMSGGSIEQEAKEANKRIVTFCAVPLCIGMAIYDLSATHEHHEEVPDYPYLRIRGDCGLFEDCEKEHGDEEE
eukprot:jgi/Astpho2/7896/Aster-06378